MHTTVILVNYQNYADTIACLTSLRTAMDQGLRVIVVDNASLNESEEALRQYLEREASGQITLLVAEKNRGFAAGNNLGIQHALEEHSAEFIWLLNTDTLLQPGAWQHLLAAARAHPEVRIWGSTIRDAAPPHALQSAAGFSYQAWLSIPQPVLWPEESLPKGLFQSLDQMDYVSGVSMFIPAEVLREAGPLDESYFLFYEELELTRKVGGKAYLAWCPESVIFHKGGGSTGSQDPNRGKGSFAAHYYGNLSALRYTWRYHRLAFPLVCTFRLLAKSLLFIRYGNWRAFGPLFKAYADFLF